jgi:hypothetical protein
MVIFIKISGTKNNCFRIGFEVQYKKRSILFVRAFASPLKEAPLISLTSITFNKEIILKSHKNVNNLEEKC